MIRFLANVIEQLDLAMDHIILRDPNHSRFALMLVDNAIEITLHSYAEDRSAENRGFGRPENAVHDQKALEQALGQRFDAKVRLASVCGLLDQSEAASINVLHSYRNQVYHRGLQYEDILHSLALFYFRIVCGVLKKYKPDGYWWGSGLTVPHRARKYIGSEPFRKVPTVFEDAFSRLEEVSHGVNLDLAADLHRHMAKVIDQTDEELEFIATNNPTRTSRDAIVIDAQAWAFAFTDEAKTYAAENGCMDTRLGPYVKWIADHYPWPIRIDPIPSWRKRSSSLESETDNHAALRKYHEFVTQTADLREEISSSAAALDAHIEEQIDRARGK